MTIEHKHNIMSPRAADWLLRVINPFATQAPRTDPLPARDVESLLKAAELHGVLPLVLKALKAYSEGTAENSWLFGSASDIAAANDAVRSARTLQLHQTGLELLLVHHAQQILAKLQAVGGTAAIVKGPVFARRLYAVPGLRTFTDVDLLISPSDRDTTKAIMTGLGFMLAEQAYRGSEEYFEDKWFLKKNPQVLIEIHSNLVHNPRLRRSASVALDNVRAAGAGDCEDATALLFVAAAHGALSHQFDRLQHVLDVALAASGRAGPVDADRLRIVSEASGVLTSVYAGLSLASRMFPHPALLPLARTLQPRLSTRLAAGLITPRVVLDARSQQRGHSSWRRKAFRQLIRLTGSRQKL